MEAALRTTEQSLAKLHRLLDKKPIEYVAMDFVGEMQAYCDIEDDMVKGNVWNDCAGVSEEEG